VRVGDLGLPVRLWKKRRLLSLFWVSRRNEESLILRFRILVNYVVILY
jgi:hypothetical protein